MANFGIGIGAFAEGFTRGMSIGEKYRKASKEWDIEKAQKAALDDARAARDAHVEKETNVLLKGGPDGPDAPEAPAAEATPVRTPDVQPVAGSDASAPPAAQSAPAAAGLPPQPAPDAPVPQTQTVTQAPPAERTIETPPPAAAQPASQPKPVAAPAAAVLGANPKRPVSQEDARKIAEGRAPSVMEFFQKQGVPKVAEAFLAQGNIQMADAWTKWAEESEGKRTMKTWAKAWSATQRGDLEGAADHVFELYKNYSDGSTPVSKETVKDKAGNVTGFNVKLRDEKTGEERSTFVDRDQLLNMGLSALSPPEMFKAAYAQKESADKAKAAAQAKAGEIQMQTAKEIAVERARQGGRVELEGIKTQNETTRDGRLHENNLERDVQKGSIDAQNQRNKVQQELDAKVGALAKAGYSEEFIKNALPDILGVNQYKKTTSPEEAKRLAFSDRMKNDPSFGRKTPEQQRVLIENDMSLIYGGMKPTDAPANPQPAAPNPAAKGLPVLDKKTGQVIYR